LKLALEASGLQHLEDFGNATKPSQGGNKRVSLLEERRERESNREQVDLDEMQASDR
jgi:hypothetical protein